MHIRNFSTQFDSSQLGKAGSEMGRPIREFSLQIFHLVDLAKFQNQSPWILSNFFAKLSLLIGPRACWGRLISEMAAIRPTLIHKNPFLFSTFSVGRSSLSVSFSISLFLCSCVIIRWGCYCLWNWKFWTDRWRKKSTKLIWKCLLIAFMSGFFLFFLRVTFVFVILLIYCTNI